MNDHPHPIQKSARPVAVTLPDGSRRDFPGPVTGADVAAAIGPGLAKAAIAVKIEVARASVDLDRRKRARPRDRDRP